MLPSPPALNLKGIEATMEDYFIDFSLGDVNGGKNVGDDRLFVR